MKIIRIPVGALQTNCYLFVCGKELAVIDPGGEAEKILREIEKTGAQPRYIINTHYHDDHVLGNGGLKKKTGAPVMIHENEKDFSDFAPDRFLKDGEEIKIGECSLKAVLTPGHSAGSICLFGPGIVFSGDTIFEAGGVGRWDLPGGSIDDLKLSLEKLNSRIKPETPIYPGHGREFNFKKYNGF
jgi:glyoxylase-like metal-dependent hydrolase (beta-lactamase superfamily II)